MAEKKLNVFEKITNEVIAALEKGVRPWAKPWSTGAGSMPLRHSGQPYRGVNVIALWCSALSNGFTGDKWMTYNQAKNLGGQVRKGSKGTTVVYCHIVETENAAGDTEKSFRGMRAHTVFNVDQIDNLDDHYYPEEPEVFSDDREFPEIDLFFDKAGITAKVTHGGGAAFYSPSDDTIQMPEVSRFKSKSFYYSTLSHESIHLTGHAGRLDRDKQYHTKTGRAKEELIAELGAAFLSAQFGIRGDVKEESEAYLATWLKHLKNDSKFIFSAASQAQAAVKFLNDKVAA